MTTARAHMRMRCKVERDVVQDREGQPLNQPQVERQLVDGNLPCHAWLQNVRQVANDDRIVNITIGQMLAPIEAELLVEDVVTVLHDYRLGRDYPLGAQPYRIAAPPVPWGKHQEVQLERIP